LQACLAVIGVRAINRAPSNLGDMAKKKSKKSQKQVENAPTDSAPAPDEPIPDVPEVPLTAEASIPDPMPDDQPQIEAPATDVTSREESVPSLPEVDTTEPSELPSPHLENPGPILSDAAQLPVTEVASDLESDPTARKGKEIEPQAVSTQITEGQAIKHPKDPHAYLSESEHPLTTELSEVPVTALSLLDSEQERPITKEEESTQPIEESTPTPALDLKPGTAAEPETVPSEPPVVSIQDAEHPLTLADARELEVDSEAPAQNAPLHADDSIPLERPMDIAVDEEREEPRKGETEDATVAPEAPLAPVQDVRNIQTIPTEAEQPLAAELSGVFSDELPPSVPKVPLAQSYHVERSTTEAQGLTDAGDEKRRRKAARLERYRLEQDRLDEQELEQKRAEDEAKKATEAAERAREAEAEELERLEQEKAEKDQLSQEAEARKLLERLEQERRATEAHEKMIADEAAERAQEAEAKAEEQCKDLESKDEQESMDCGKSEQEAMARELLKQMELERHAEAQEAADAAKRTQEEAEVREELQRVELERLEVEAREIAGDVRIAAEQASKESTPHSSEPQQEVLDSARAPLPRTAASSPHDRPASATSDRPSRSQRSPAPHVPKLRTQEAGPYHAPAPKPQAVSQLIEDSRPPAPSPPIGRGRPRYAIPFFSVRRNSLGFYSVIVIRTQIKVLRRYKYYASNIAEWLD
jgi:serine/arginine repetitive matrix protein 2